MSMTYLRTWALDDIQISRSHGDGRTVEAYAAVFDTPTEINDRPRLNADVQSIIDAGIPVLLVRGRVSDLVTEEGAKAFCSRFPQVEFVDVSGAGHMVAGDRNDAFTAAVVDFLDRHHPL